MLVNKSMYPVKAGYSAISTMQGQLGKLQTQLGSGQKAQTLAEMGSDRTVSLATRGRLTKLESFSANIDTVNLRLGFLDQAFTALNGLKSETRNSATPTSFGENGLVMASLQKDSDVPSIYEEVCEAAGIPHLGLRSDADNEENRARIHRFVTERLGGYLE